MGSERTPSTYLNLASSPIKTMLAAVTIETTMVMMMTVMMMTTIHHRFSGTFYCSLLAGRVRHRFLLLEQVLEGGGGAHQKVRVKRPPFLAPSFPTEIEEAKPRQAQDKHKKNLQQLALRTGIATLRTLASSPGGHR